MFLKSPVLFRRHKNFQCFKLFLCLKYYIQKPFEIPKYILTITISDWQNKKKVSTRVEFKKFFPFIVALVTTILGVKAKKK